jgi:hypothetical protein
MWLYTNLVMPILGLASKMFGLGMLAYFVLASAK